VQIGPKLRFKLTKEQPLCPSITQHLRFMHGFRKHYFISGQDVSNSIPFDALNTIENDDELGTNVGNSKLAEKGSTLTWILLLSRDHHSSNKD
ncbi:hypothetical protein Tco_0429110, partial [Tanacetum coccineum]